MLLEMMFTASISYTYMHPESIFGKFLFWSALKRCFMMIFEEPQTPK